MPAYRQQKPGPPPGMRFTPVALWGGLRGTARLGGVSFRERLRITLDYARQNGKRGITDSEYFCQYHFYRLTREERESFLTIAEAQHITWPLSQEIRDVFWHKDRFLTAFSAFARRDWLKIEPGALERFRTFCKKHPRLIQKPLASTGGMGIRILDEEDTQAPDALFSRLLKQDCIVEEILRGDRRLSTFHPASLNTVRVVTLYNGTHFEVFGAVVRFGRSGKKMDNVSSGGIFAALDPNTGIILTDAMDMAGLRYERHPDTGKAFRGFQVPRWREVLDTVRRAVDVLPNIRIAGWDAALLEGGGTALVEGNHMPDVDLMQQPLEKGIRKEFEEKVRALFGERFLA